MALNKVCLFISFILFGSVTLAQNMNGTWQGVMQDGEKLQVNVKMQHNRLCGYTWDYDVQNPSSYCKAIFSGWYDSDQQAWLLMGTSFIENSGSHILMLLRLWHEAGDPANTLRGTVESKSSAMSIFNMGGGREWVQLRKVSATPSDGMPDCFPELVKKNSPVIKKTARVKKTVKPVQPQTAKKIIEKPVIIPKKTDPKNNEDTDSLKNIKRVNPVATISPDDDLMVKKMNARKNTAISHIVVNEKNLTLYVYDNGIVDNDTVSIFYNGKLIAGKKGLSEKPLVIHLQLDEKAILHEIVMFAENLGSIAPNTALIVVTTGDKRYELHSSSSLTENAVLTFEYKPK